MTYYLKPIRGLGSFFFSSILAESSPIAMYRLSICSRTSSDKSLKASKSSSLCCLRRSTFARNSFNSLEKEEVVSRYSLTCTKALIIAIFAWTATLLCNRPDNIATPCSVKARGIFLRPPQLDITICDFKFLKSSFSSLNIKSSGNLSRFRCTAWFKARVSTWYNLARSKSSITFFPRISWIGS